MSAAQDEERPSTPPDPVSSAPETDEETVNSTLTELALMLVFVFSLFGAAAVATGGAGEKDPNSEFRVAIDTALPSCLYEPSKDSAAVPFGPGKVQMTVPAETGKPAQFNVNTRDDSNAPKPIGLLSVRWLGLDTSRPSSVEPSYRFQVEFIPQVQTSAKSVKSPFNIIDNQASYALSAAISAIRPGGQEPDWVSPANSMPSVISLNTRSLGSGDRVYLFAEWIMELNQRLYEAYDCVFFVDLLDYPSVEWLKSRNAPPALINASGAYRNGLRGIIGDREDPNNFVNRIVEPT